MNMHNDDPVQNYKRMISAIWKFDFHVKAWETDKRINVKSCIDGLKLDTINPMYLTCR